MRYKNEWNGTNPTPDTIQGLRAIGFIRLKNYKRQCSWNNKMALLLARKPKSMRGFSFMPKGEVV